MKPIRIVLADDHAVLRAGLRMLINAQPDMEVVGEASEGRAAIERATALRPDVMVLDLAMDGLGGLAALPILTEKVPETKVLVLTMYDDAGYLRQVLDAGGSGYIVKKAADVELLSAIRAVSQGEMYVHSSLTKALVGGPRENRRAARGSDRVEELSGRERQVFGLLAQGYTNQQMADELFLSVKTIETYRSRLMEKLQLQTRAELVRYAMQKGLLRPKG